LLKNNIWSDGAAPAYITVVLGLPCNVKNNITLSWSIGNNSCNKISSFKIYQNDILIETVPYQITTYNLTVDTLFNSFYVTSVSNNTESLPSNTVTQSSNNLFSATGNYTTYCNNGFFGIVFDYQAGTQSLTLFYPQLVTLIVVGGGGGGTDMPSDFPYVSVGGGGGGITYIQNLYLNSGTYNINVGPGGSGSSGSSGGSGTSGGQSNFGQYISYGGGGGQIANSTVNGGSINSIYGGGGGMGGNFGFPVITSINNNISGTNSLSGNQGNYPQAGNGNGGNSYYANSSIPIFVPFITLNSTITVGGGGGGGVGNTGGAAGKGIGGAYGGSINNNGENSNNSIYTGYGGGGGGNGGNGVVIVYWPSYNVSYINTNNFIGNYVIYNNNGYIGYVFSYGSGTITFNQNLNNVNIILCGGGGGGGDGSNNPNTNTGGGGGGGGTAYFSGLSFSNNQQFNIIVGTGGTYIQPNGTNSTFGNNSNFIGYGGLNSNLTTCNGGNGGNGNGNGGGGGGGGGGYTNSGSSTGGTGGSIMPGNTNQGSSGQSNTNPISNGAYGGNSYLYNNNNNGIQMPFLPGQPSIQFGGGGQGSITTSSRGGQSGLGVGGSQNNPTGYFGENGTNNINSGFGGGGGGGSVSLTPGGAGGIGGNGVIILWWQL